MRHRKRSRAFVPAFAALAPAFAALATACGAPTRGFEPIARDQRVGNDAAAPGRQGALAATGSASDATRVTIPSPSADRALPSVPAEATAVAPSALAPTLAPTPTLTPAPEPALPRLTSQASYTWIYGRPRADKRYIGLIRIGTSVALRSVEMVKGEGCSAGFYQVAPRGFVCSDHTVTLEPSPRFLASASLIAPSPGPFPYRYAFSDGAPMYNRVATEAEQRRFEARYGLIGSPLPLPKVLAAHEDLAVREAIAPSGKAPSLFEGGALFSEARAGLYYQTLPLGSMVAYTSTFTAEGRTWLVSADQSLVPADRVRPFRPSTFHGVRLGDDVKLPLAWMRKTPKAKHHRLASGDFEKTGETWPLRGFVGLTGASVVAHGRRYLETTESAEGYGPLYIAEWDATVAAPLEKLPRGVGPDQKSIVARISDGTLVAYEGRKPVYATLMSPGAGGPPMPGQDPVTASTTPVGTYYVTFKNRATTMSPDMGDGRTFWIADVPHTQYFNPPFALHAAYWHERFGEPTSAGCINVSPLDAEALFQWSDPQVPAEWQGATGAGAPENGATTAIVVYR